MKISEVKQEYQLQEWSGMLRQRKESGSSVKEWCQEQGMAEHIYYYWLRKLRQAACTALEQAQPVQLAEVPLAPKPEESHSKLWLTTKTGTLEITSIKGQSLYIKTANRPTPYALADSLYLFYLSKISSLWNQKRNRRKCTG